MTSAIAIVVVLILLVLMALAGFRDGVFFSVYALLRNVFAFICAMTFCEPLARLLEKLITNAYPAYDYFVAISFAAVFGAVFALARWLKVSYTVPGVGCPELVDRIVGPALGVLSAVVVTGALLILWSLLPFARYIPGDHGRIQIKSSALDTGAVMLRFYSFVEQRMGGGRAFLLHDEPIELDNNKNGRAEPGDGYFDTNKNGRWDRGWLWRYRNYANVNPSDLQPMLGGPGG